MIENQHLLCAPELKRYNLVSLFNNTSVIVTDSILADGFKENPSELQKIYSGRSAAWFLEEIFD